MGSAVITNAWKLHGSGVLVPHVSCLLLLAGSAKSLEGHHGAGEDHEAPAAAALTVECFASTTAEARAQALPPAWQGQHGDSLWG